MLSFWVGWGNFIFFRMQPLLRHHLANCHGQPWLWTYLTNFSLYHHNQIHWDGASCWSEFLFLFSCTSNPLSLFISFDSCHFEICFYLASTMFLFIKEGLIWLLQNEFHSIFQIQYSFEFIPGRINCKRLLASQCRELFGPLQSWREGERFRLSSLPLTLSLKPHVEFLNAPKWPASFSFI